MLIFGNVFIFVCDGDKDVIVDIVCDFVVMKYMVFLIGGMVSYLENAGVFVIKVKKVYEGRFYIGDMICNGEIGLMVVILFGDV